MKNTRVFVLLVLLMVIFTSGCAPEKTSSPNVGVVVLQDIRSLFPDIENSLVYESAGEVARMKGMRAVVVIPDDRFVLLQIRKDVEPSEEYRKVDITPDVLQAIQKR